MKKSIFSAIFFAAASIALAAEINLNGGKIIPLDLKMIESFTEDLNFCFATRYSDNSIHLTHSKGMHTITERSCAEVSFDNGKSWQKPPKDFTAAGMTAYETRDGKKCRVTVWERKALKNHKLSVIELDENGKATIRYAEIELPYATSAHAHRDVLRTKTGRLIGTAYGMKEGASKSHIFSYYSDDDGQTWHFLSTIAEPEFNDVEGANESTLVELADGTILVIYRVDGNKACRQKRSSDDGLTWSKSELAANFGASPHAILLENGTLAFVTGRPGLYLYLDFTGTGKNYQRYCLWKGSTSSYASILEVAPNEIMVIYDESNFGAGRTDGLFARIMAATYKIEKISGAKVKTGDPREEGFDLFYSFYESKNPFAKGAANGYSTYKSNSAHAYIHEIPERQYPVMRFHSCGTPKDGREWVRCDIPSIPIGVKKAEYELELRLMDNVTPKMQFTFSVVMAAEEGKNLWAYVGFGKNFIQYIQGDKRVNIPFDFGIAQFKNIIIKCDAEKGVFEIYEKGKSTPLATSPMTPTKNAPGMSIGDGSGQVYGIIDLSYLGVKYLDN